MQRLFSCLLLIVAHAPLYGQQGSASVLERADVLLLNSKFQEALALLDNATAGSSKALIQNKKAEALIRLGRYSDAERLFQEIQAQLRPADVRLQGITESNLAFLQLNQGRSDLAEESLQSALKKLESGKANNAEVAQALSHLGLTYMSQGKYTQAQELMHRVLTLRQNLKENKEAFIAATLNDLGIAYSQTDKDMALDFYEQAHKMYLKLYGDQDPKIAISNINIGIVYRDLELYGDAINNFETALKIWNNVTPDPNPAKAIALYNLGQTYLQLNDNKAAREYYNRALEMYKKVYGERHPEIASVFNAMGNLETSQSAFDEALRLYQEALKANVPGFTSDDPASNPALADYYNGTRLLHTLLFKAQAFESRYTRKSLKFSDLTDALSLLARCDSLIDQLRQHSTNENDKILLGAMANEVYSDGVRIAYVAGLNAVRKQSYFEKAFYFAEKSKGAVLLESISDANAKSFAGIPQALLEEEKTLKSSISLTAQRLAQRPAPEEEKKLRNTSFELKQKYQNFVQKLEKEFAEYFNLKFNSRTPSVPELQKLMDEKTALVSYFIDDKNAQLYLFVIRKTNFRVWQKNIPATFEKYITGLRNSLYFQEISTFKTSASNLGRTLLPTLPASVTDLVIVPTGRLGLIPFETLLTADAEKIATYEALPYLMKRYSVRYEFSAGLLLQKENDAARKSQNSIFLCAPVSFSQRTNLRELPGSEKEVGEISTLFKNRKLTATAYTGAQASEKLIKDGHAKGFGFIHFATHGIVDESNPELSRIFLQGDKQNDGDLFSGEIYNLDLNADLVTLSACQTGLGKVLKGEGVIGLSRALVYAGARKVMVSYWNVADESTAVLMKSFYQNILEDQGAPFSHALRAAKLELLNDPKYGAPYYWAPFVLIGY